MSPAAFSFPTTTLFGAGALAALPARLETLRLQRPLVVTDAGLLGTPAFESLRQTLGAKEQGRNWFLCSRVHANPLQQDVVDAAEAFRANDCDGVIALGDGSPLDVGKAGHIRQLVLQEIFF